MEPQPSTTDISLAEVPVANMVQLKPIVFDLLTESEPVTK